MNDMTLVNECLNRGIHVVSEQYVHFNDFARFEKCFPDRRFWFVTENSYPLFDAIREYRSISIFRHGVEYSCVLGDDEELDEQNIKFIITRKEMD